MIINWSKDPNLRTNQLELYDLLKDARYKNYLHEHTNQNLGLRTKLYQAMIIMIKIQ